MNGYENDDELILTDPGAAQRARAGELRRDRRLALTPTSGVVTPPPQPGASPLTPTTMRPGDYRAKAFTALEQAAQEQPAEADVEQLRQFAKERGEGSMRDMQAAFALQALGGETMRPFGAQMLSRALAAQEPEKFGGGLIAGGKFIADPRVGAQDRATRLEMQARQYEAMASHAESVEQREAATKAAADLRREIAAATAARAGERADETRSARTFTQENALRDDFEKQVKDQRISIATYPQIEAALTNKTPTAAGDMRAIFRYMKMLDPTSVVREGEFATARNAAGIPERISNIYNRALQGTMLTPQQRTQFLDQAKSERDTALNFFNERASEFGSRASGYGLNPRNVILGYEGAGGRDAPPPGAVREKR